MHLICFVELFWYTIKHSPMVDDQWLSEVLEETPKQFQHRDDVKALPFATMARECKCIEEALLAFGETVKGWKCPFRWQDGKNELKRLLEQFIDVQEEAQGYIELLDDLENGLSAQQKLGKKRWRAQRDALSAILTRNMVPKCVARNVANAFHSTICDPSNFGLQAESFYNMELEIEDTVAASRALFTKPKLVSAPVSEPAEKPVGGSVGASFGGPAPPQAVPPRHLTPFHRALHDYIQKDTSAILYKRKEMIETLAKDEKQHCNATVTSTSDFNWNPDLKEPNHCFANMA